MTITYGKLPEPAFLPTFMPHPQQGTLDGACAICCAGMLLEYYQLAVPALDVGDRRTQFARLLHRLAPQDPLVVKGVRLAHLSATLRALPLPQAQRLRVEELRAPRDRARLLRFLHRHIGQGRPGLLLYESVAPRRGHLVVVVGVSVDDARTWLYVMDPALPHQEGLVFNARLTLYERGGTLYLRNAQGGRLTVQACLVVWPQRPQQGTPGDNDGE